MEQYNIQDMQAMLPFFIDAEFPKGKNKERGAAIVHVCLFIHWLNKNVRKSKKKK